MGLVPRPLDDECLTVRNRPSPDLDRDSGVLRPPSVHGGLTGPVAAQDRAGRGVDDLVDGTRSGHGSSLPDSRGRLRLRHRCDAR
jgi:hypothetical protein